MVDTEDWIEKLYREQRAGYQATFKGKRQRIEQQYDEFWRQGPAQDDADAYRNNTPDHKYGQGLPNQDPASLKKWVQSNTFFTSLFDKMLCSTPQVTDS